MCFLCPPTPQPSLLSIIPSFFWLTPATFHPWEDCDQHYGRPMPGPTHLPRRLCHLLLGSWGSRGHFWQCHCKGSQGLSKRWHRRTSGPLAASTLPSHDSWYYDGILEPLWYLAKTMDNMYSIWLYFSRMTPGRWVSSLSCGTAQGFSLAPVAIGCFLL